MTTIAIIPRNEHVFVQHSFFWQLKHLVLAIAATICTIFTGFLCGTWLSTLWKQGLSGKEILPLKAHAPLRITGNSSLSEAELIAFPEDHLDKAFQQDIYTVIDENYREGDLVLVEAHQAGKPVNRDKYPLSSIPKRCKAEGWDDKNALFSAPTLRLHKENCKKLKKLSIDLERILPENASFNPNNLKQMQELDQNIQEFKDNIIQLSEYFLEKENFNPSEIRKKIDNGVHAFKEKNLKDNKASLTYFLTKFITPLEKARDEALYRHLSTTEAAKTGIPRNASLTSSIHRSHKPGRRVFIIGGTYHFLRAPAPLPDCADVRKALAEHKFVLITRHPLSGK